MNRNMYDTDVTTWSPQGRLFQVEYAMEAVKQGSATLGLVSENFAVIAALKRAPSELASPYKKVFRIDDHVGMSMSGLTSDGRALTRYMRKECMNHKFVYESPLQVGRLVADVADKHQRCTQSYVRRPYGLGMLMIGYDKTGTHLYQTSPSGNFWEWRAVAIGARSQSAKTYLEKNFESFENLDRDELINHALRALAGCTEAEKELSVDNTTIAFVGKDTPFTILDGDEMAPLLERVRGSLGRRRGGAAAPAEGQAGDTTDAAGTEDVEM